MSSKIPENRKTPKLPHSTTQVNISTNILFSLSSQKEQEKLAEKILGQTGNAGSAQKHQTQFASFYTIPIRSHSKTSHFIFDGLPTPFFTPLKLSLFPIAQPAFIKLKTQVLYLISTNFHQIIISIYHWLTTVLLSRFSRVRLCATPQRAAHQAPPSLGFSRQEHWSGLPFPSPMQESEK